MLTCSMQSRWYHVEIRQAKEGIPTKMGGQESDSLFMADAVEAYMVTRALWTICSTLSAWNRRWNAPALLDVKGSRSPSAHHVPTVSIYKEMNTRPLNEHREAAPLRTIRSALLALFLIGILGTGAELLLLEHFEDVWQYVPLVLMVIGLGVLAWHGVAGGAASLRAFQGTMLFFVVGGLLGLYLHYQGNVEFELEMYPSLKGWGLFWEALKGATPALAPGAIIQLGLLGLAYTYRHPALVKSSKKKPENQ